MRPSAFDKVKLHMACGARPCLVCMIQCIILSNLHLNYILSGQNRHKQKGSAGRLRSPCSGFFGIQSLP